MKRALTCLTVLVVACPLWAQSREADEIQTVKLEVRPAAAPEAALRYRLLPPILDQTPGNAAQYYYIAAQEELSPGEGGQLVRWLETPLKQLPPREIEALAGGKHLALEYLELAARRERCHWDLPIRSQGISLLLPSLTRYRALGRLLAVKARLEIAQGRTEEAIHTLQTGLALARDVAEGPTLIQSLVGTYIASLTLSPVEELLQQPQAPNLYWALTALPRPFIDLRGPMQWEGSWLYTMAPQLRNLEKAHLTAQQWQGVADDLAEVLGNLVDRDQTAWKPKLGLTALSIYLYPRAKQYLIEKGKTPEQVEAMPVPQVVAMYTLETFARLRDEQFKWFYLPYWQARERLRRAEQEMAQERGRFMLNPFLALLPTVSRAYFLTTKVDRRIAALRCVEAVRMYAATHEGRLPKALSEIMEAPIPMDPVTGGPFRYLASGGTFAIEGLAPEGEAKREGIRYEVTVVGK